MNTDDEIRHRALAMEQPEDRRAREQQERATAALIAKATEPRNSKPDVRPAVTLDLDDLERKARAAEQDEWRWRPGEDDVLEGIHHGQVVLFPATIGHTIPSEIIANISDREHIAAASPPVVLALIAQVRLLGDSLRAAMERSMLFEQEAVRLEAIAKAATAFVDEQGKTASRELLENEHFATDEWEDLLSEVERAGR